MCTYFGDTSVVGDWRSRRLLVRSQIARGALTALPPSQRRLHIARLRESGRHARAAPRTPTTPRCVPSPPPHSRVLAVAQGKCTPSTSTRRRAALDFGRASENVCIALRGPRRAVVRILLSKNTAQALPVTPLHRPHSLAWRAHALARRRCCADGSRLDGGVHAGGGRPVRGVARQRAAKHAATRAKEASKAPKV